MSYYDQLRGLSGLYYCDECGGFHAPERSSYPSPRGGGYRSRGDYPPLRSPIPSSSSGGRKRRPTRFRDPWGGQDPYADAIEVSGPDDGRYPTYSERPIPTLTRPPPRRPAPAPRPLSPPQNYDGYSSGRGAVSGSRGGPVYDEGDIPAIPKLPPIDRRNKIKPKNPNETFLNPAVLRGAEIHPVDSRYPKEFYGRLVPVESMTLEEQSARAFIMDCVDFIPWAELAEDMYDLAKKGKVPATLIAHLKYFMAAVLPHLRAGREMPPGDYCKARRCIDWMAEVGEVMGTALTWSEGFQKGGGHAREGGWWRKERLGFPEGRGVSDGMI